MTEVIPAALDARPSLSSAVVALLKMIARGAPPDGTIELRERGGADHQRVQPLPVHLVKDCLPELLLRIYETSASPWSVGLSVHAAGVTVSALTVSWGYVRGFHRIKGPGGRTLTEPRWVWPSEEIEAHEAALDAWACPPTMVIRSLPTSEAGQVVGLWALAEPLRDPGDALGTMRDMASALGGVVPVPRATIADIPLPGTSASNQDPRVVECIRLNEKRVYGLAEIKAALSAAGRKR